MSFSTTFAHGIGIALDYGAELAFFWRLHEPMTISSRAGLALRKGQKWTFLAMLGRFLNWLSANHTAEAIQADIERAQQAIKDLTA